jgi:hypothetical protein
VALRIAGGQGFYGDDVASTRPLLESGIDYLCLEGLAELTLAILQKDRQRDETLGFTRDLPRYLRVALPFVAAGRTKVITNAGGINPVAAGRAATETARALGLRGLKVATVVGDDLTARLGAFREAGVTLDNAETGEPWSAFVAGRDGEGPPPVLFASTYLGAAPIVEALRAGADIVITGRVADSTLFLAPLVHEFGWAFDDWDRLAAGTVVGHLCECSGQSTGGNLSGAWWTVPEPWSFGFPIAECEADGTAVLTKAPGTGGRVDFDTVRHQLLYEVHDPSRYLAPDVVADFTSLEVTDVGRDRVRLSGSRGLAATPTYKALIAHESGWSGETRVAFAWPDAHVKAVATAAIFRRRVALAGHRVEEWHEEYWGVNALGGPTAPLDAASDAPEVSLRVAWRCPDRASAAAIAREMVPLGLSAPPWGLTASGRTVVGKPSQLLGLWPVLVDKALVDPSVHVAIEET